MRLIHRCPCCRSCNTHAGILAHTTNCYSPGMDARRAGCLLEGACLPRFACFRTLVDVRYLLHHAEFCRKRVLWEAPWSCKCLEGMPVFELSTVLTYPRNHKLITPGKVCADAL